MAVSQRHTKRLLAAYRRDGTAALAHGNRGRRPHNAIPEAAAAAVVKLASNHYAGANHTHLTELLREREGIDLSRPTVRRILARAGMGSPRSRRSPQHRFRRRRMPQEGMLVQIDGSHYPWLEERGPRFVLLLAVDDATGVMAQVVFRTAEDTRGYLALLEGMVRQWGIPLLLQPQILTEVLAAALVVAAAGPGLMAPSPPGPGQHRFVQRHGPPDQPVQQAAHLGNRQWYPGFIPLRFSPFFPLKHALAFCRTTAR